MIPHQSTWFASIIVSVFFSSVLDNDDNDSVLRKQYFLRENMITGLLLQWISCSPFLLFLQSHQYKEEDDAFVQSVAMFNHIHYSEIPARMGYEDVFSALWFVSTMRMSFKDVIRRVWEYYYHLFFNEKCARFPNNREQAHLRIPARFCIQWQGLPALDSQAWWHRSYMFHRGILDLICYWELSAIEYRAKGILCIAKVHKDMQCLVNSWRGKK